MAELTCWVSYWLVGLCLVQATALQAQTGFTVRGTVTDRQTGGGVVATVTLEDAGRTLSSESGEFEIRGVRPGRYALTVEALGYRTARTTILVMEDVTGTIRLDPEPIPLEPVDVRPAELTLRGRVVEKGSGNSAPYVTIDLGPAGQTTTNDAGGFRIGGILRGRHTVRVEGFGWLPASIRLAVEADTSLIIEIERDPITDRIIARQIGELSERVRSVGVSLATVDRREMVHTRAANPVEVLSSRAGVRVQSCPDTSLPLCIYARGMIRRPLVYIDDVLIPDGLDVLRLYPNALIERMEVIAHGGQIRVYTTWFIQRMTEGRVRLMPIFR